MKRNVCGRSDAARQAMIELYRRWEAVQGEADRLRGELFGLPVRDSVGREGRIYRINTQGIFVRFDGAPLEEKMHPDELKLLGSP